MTNTEKKEYIKNGLKTKMTDNLNSEIIPTMQAFAEVLKENEEELKETLNPLIETYGELIGKFISVCVKPASKEYVRSLIDAVSELEAHGFTREEAIRLLGR